LLLKITDLKKKKLEGEDGLNETTFRECREGTPPVETSEGR